MKVPSELRNLAEMVLQPNRLLSATAAPSGRLAMTPLMQSDREMR